MKRIGIPRGLLFYKYFVLWKEFLKGLGFEVLISPPTTKEILLEGVRSCVDEACFAVKVFCGHVAYLKDKVDYLFIPRYASVEKKGFLCAKFWGLPDIIRNTFPDAPVILSPNIDCNKRSLFEAYLFFALELKKSFFKILKSWQSAQNKQKEFELLMEEKRFGLLEAMGLTERDRILRRDSPSVRIALLGHPYNIYDSVASQDILKRLEDMGAEVSTAEMVSKDRLQKESGDFWNIYWTYDRELAGAVQHFLKEGIDGVIFIVSFPCGPDSLIIDYLTRLISDRLPVLNLVIDEHQSEVGVLTRLEAFIEIVRRRKR